MLEELVHVLEVVMFRTFFWKAIEGMLSDVSNLVVSLDMTVEISSKVLMLCAHVDIMLA